MAFQVYCHTLQYGRPIKPNKSAIIKQYIVCLLHLLLDLQYILPVPAQLKAVYSMP